MTDATTEPSEDEDSDLGYIKRIALAEPDTTLGKLQRGRGAGWLECLELPRDEANDLLWQCIVFDPRVDQQVESRSEYYASLALQTGLDVSRLTPDELPNMDSWRDRWLLAQVLMRLDRAGVAGAGTALLAQITPRDDVGEFVLTEVRLASEATIARLPAALVKQRNDENLIGTVTRFHDDFPWERWATDYSRIAAALGEVRRVRDDEEPRPQPSLPEGYRHLICGFPPPYDDETMRRLATEVRPALEALI